MVSEDIGFEPNGVPGPSNPSHYIGSDNDRELEHLLEDERLDSHIEDSAREFIEEKLKPQLKEEIRSDVEEDFKTDIKTEIHSELLHTATYPLMALMLIMGLYASISINIIASIPFGFAIIFLYNLSRELKR